MHVKAIHTRILTPPEDNLRQIFDEYLPPLREKTILAVSSKIVAIGQGRCVPIPQDGAEKKALKLHLIKEESDQHLHKNDAFPYSTTFTVYEGVLGSAAGIDESNANGYFVLLPKNVEKEAKSIRSYLTEKYKIKQLGVVIVDSRSTPVRNGTTGVALGYAGFKALEDYRGTQDLFGRELTISRMNIADCLASTATLAMGEGNESTPLVCMTDLPHVLFTEDRETDPLLLPNISMEKDTYAQFFINHPWQKKQ